MNSKTIIAHPTLYYTTHATKWLLVIILVGLLAGSASALFLSVLNLVTNYRENNVWIIALLPLGGLLIGLSYHYYGSSVVKGNNLLLEEFHDPKQVIPFKMVPLVLFGTLVTHLFGGSAGREGTAVQMGGAIADQFTRFFTVNPINRKILIIMGVSAGFASVFGTPLAGAVFALEVMVVLGSVRFKAIIPSLLVAYIAHYTCLFWNVSHTHYTIPFIQAIQVDSIFLTLFCGILFGLAALLFSNSVHFFTNLFKYISYPPLRPVAGGVVIALAVWALGTTKYIGLGVPTIVDSFTIEQPQYAFILKLLLTTFTLGAGFKGGEVTPLFFVGATLGNVLCLFIPLPMALLAGMGFVAVFSGATNTPIACTIMGMELFGWQCGLYMGIACGVAYLFSGSTGIYTSQLQESFKHRLYKKIRKGKRQN